MAEREWLTEQDPREVAGDTGWSIKFEGMRDASFSKTGGKKAEMGTNAAVAVNKKTAQMITLGSGLSEEGDIDWVDMMVQALNTFMN